MTGARQLSGVVVSKTFVAMTGQGVVVCRVQDRGTHCCREKYTLRTPPPPIQVTKAQRAHQELHSPECCPTPPNERGTWEGTGVDGVNRKIHWGISLSPN